MTDAHNFPINLNVLEHAEEKGVQKCIDIIKKKIEKLEGWNNRDALLIRKQLERLLIEIRTGKLTEEPVPSRNQVKRCSTCKHFKDNSPYIPCCVCYDNDRWESTIPPEHEILDILY